MLESIEIFENFEDLNRTQKYQLKVPLFRNDKQYITELENNVNYFMNQIGKNNFITEDQMEVIMPRYVKPDKKRRVNRARAQAEKVRKEVEQLRNEEKIYGKAQFKFANELPDESNNKNNHHGNSSSTTNHNNNNKLPFLNQQTLPSPRAQDALRYISTDEYKDYKFQYKPFVGAQSATLSLPLPVRHSMESTLQEKSQAYFVEQNRMQKKWQSAFKNMDGNDEVATSNAANTSSHHAIAPSGGLQSRKHRSQDNLMKSYKSPPVGYRPQQQQQQSSNAIQSPALSQSQQQQQQQQQQHHLQHSAEATEEDLLVSANNLTIHELLNNIKLRNLPATIKTPDNYIFQEFIQLAKQSLGQIALAEEGSNTTGASKHSLKDDMKNLNIKLHQLKGDSERFVLLKIFKSHFQPILERNKPSIMTRIFLALDINPHEEYSKVRWNEYYLFNKIVVDQSATVIDSIDFLIKFFGISDKKYMRTMEFIALLRLVCSKFDEFLQSKGRPSIFELLEENFTVLGLIKMESEFMSLQDLRQLLLSHKIHHSTLLQLIISTL